MRLPEKLDTKLAENRLYHSSVLESLDFFAKWFKSSGLPFFPEYTDHGPDHVEGVLRTAVAIVRDEAWSVMTAADAATLITATLLHDAAMHLSEGGFLSLLQTGTSVVPGFKDKPWAQLWEDYLAKARRFNAEQLMDILGEVEPVRRPGTSPGSWTRNDRLLIGEFIRRHHHRLAHEIAISGVPPFPANALGLKLPGDLADLAGLVARSHGMPLRDSLVYLSSTYDLREFRGVHAVFLMILLRISDYLQVQSDRAPGELLRVKTLRSPISLREWRVHASIIDVRHTHEDPEAIFVDARPGDVFAFLKIHDLLRGLQQELDISWAVLGEVYGRYEGLNDLGIILRRIRSNLDNEDSFAATVSYLPKRAVFEAASGDLLPLLITPLYGDRPEIGIRELMQNSVDAVRERIELERQLEIAVESGGDSMADVTVSVEREGEDGYYLVIKDKGIGMTADTICSYFLKLGASFRRSDAWRDRFEEVDGRSKILRSGRFGVGVLAAFLLGEEIEVATRYLDTSSSGGLIFTATPSTNLIEIRKADLPIGTTIRIRLSGEALEKLTSKEWHMSSRWDWYCLNSPSVVRVIDGSELVQRFYLPDPGGELEVNWRRVHHADYKDIQWTYSRVPSLACNGIMVMGASYGLPPDAWTEPWLKNPNLSVFDPDGKLPLDLERSSLLGRLPFLSELVDDIARDVIAFLVDNGPEVNLSGDVASWLEIAAHPALRPEDYYNGPKLLPFFFQDNGFGLAGALERVGTFLLIGYCDDFSMPVGIDWQSPVLVQLYETTQISVTLTIGPLLGVNTGDRGISRLLGSSARRVVLSEFWAERLTKGPSHVRIPKYRMADVKEELRLNGWVVWRIGNCPDITPNLVKFIEESRRGGNTSKEEAFLCAEWYAKEPVTSRSRIALVWRDVIQDEVIPYKKSERHSVLIDSHSLVEYMDRYKEVGDQWKRWR